MICIMPMEQEQVRAYLKTFLDWYAQSLDEHGLAQEGRSTQDHLAAYLSHAIGADGLPSGSTVFDVTTEDDGEHVGVVWAGGANFGFGPLLYVHDLRIFPPYRRKGYAARVLETLSTSVKQQESLRGMALSVMAGNAVAHELYAKSGFRPVSTVMFKPG